MNCCNSYGQCTQGHGCPVRQACHLPIDQDKPMHWIGRVLDVLVIVFLTGLFLWTLCFLPAWLEQRDAANSDAQRQAQRELKRDLAAAKLCRTTHPGSLVRWTADGSLVCVPTL